MKPVRLLSALFISFTLISGCIDLSDSEQEELKSFLDGYAEEENEAVGLSDARDKDYLGTTDVVESDTSGSARIGGEVAVSSIEDSTQANSLNQASFSSRMKGRTVDTLTAADFTVSFINGSGVKTTITGTYTVLIHYPSGGGDPQFIIEGLGDGVNYIVEVAVTVDGEDVNLQSVAYVPPGATKSEKAVIDPISTVVAEAVQEKVTSGFFATGGDKFSQDYISDLNETMTAVIEDIIESNPEISITNFEVAITSDTGIDNLVSKLLADEEVNASLDTLEDVAVEEKFEAPSAAEITDNQVARDYIINLFQQLFNDDDRGDNQDSGTGGESDVSSDNKGGGSQGGGDEGGVPKIFTDTFGDAFFDQEVRTIAQVMAAISAMVTPEGGVSPFGSAEQTAALTAFKQLFVDVFSGLDAVDQLENLDTLSSAQQDQLDTLREELSEFPPMLLAIFPSSRASDIAAFTSATSVTVPEALTLIFFSMGEMEDDNDNSNGGGDDGDNPYKLLELYGFDLANVDAEYKKPEVYGLEVHPGRMWVSDGANGGTEKDVLNLHTCVELPEFLDGTVNTVSLVYPTSTGPSDSITLKNRSDYYGGDTDGHEERCYVWNTWDEQRILEESGDYDIAVTEDQYNDKDWAGITADLIADGKLIEDFKSGDYVLTVNYTVTGASAADAVFTFNKTIITGLSQLNPRLITPASPPRQPEGNVSDAEWTIFHNQNAAFSATLFPEDGIGTIAWTEPEGLAAILAEHSVDGKPTIIAAYNLDIGRHSCGDDPYTDDVEETDWCGWKNIFNTWENNTQIFDTQFELPADVKAQLTTLEVNDDSYNVNLGITFLDARTGQYLGNGGWSWAQFRVGEAIDETAEFTLSGTLTNVPNSNMLDKNGTAYPASAYKVALIKENCNNTAAAGGNCTQTTIANAVIDDSTYTLTTTIADVKSTDGSWINIFMYIDENDDGEYNQGTEANDFMWEPQFWSMNHINFNTWGGVVRINFNTCNTTGMCDWYEEAVVPGTDYDGPDFDTEPQEFNSADTAAGAQQKLTTT